MTAGTDDDPRALSITAAADDDGARGALIDDAGALAFAAAAAAIHALPVLPPDDVTHAHPLVASPGRATLLAIWAALERRTPLGLVHARATADERAALSARLAAAPVPVDTLAVGFTSG